MKPNLGQYNNYWTHQRKNDWIYDLKEKLQQRKQEWLNSSEEHPFPNCKTCTVEWINDLLGITSDAEKEVEKKEGEGKGSTE